MTNNHPNPKDQQEDAYNLAAWIVDFEFFNPANRHMDRRKLIELYSSKLLAWHHTALTSFRDEVLATLPIEQSERWHVSHAVHEAQCWPELRAWAVEDALLEQRKTIQTISERHGI